jgi:hypothetical protein
MAKFRLLAGKHVISTDPLTKAVPGDIVESDKNLVELFGDNKFELVAEAATDVSESVVESTKKPVKKGA